VTCPKSRTQMGIDRWMSSGSRLYVALEGKRKRHESL
jgi:hypothetical protein